MSKHNFDTDKPVKHEPLGKEKITRNDEGRIESIQTDEHVSHKSDHAVQIPEEVHRDADDFENTRTAPSPAEVFAKSESKSSSSSKS